MISVREFEYKALCDARNVSYFTIQIMSGPNIFDCLRSTLTLVHFCLSQEADSIVGPEVLK